MAAVVDDPAVETDMCDVSYFSHIPCGFRSWGGVISGFFRVPRVQLFFLDFILD